MSTPSRLAVIAWRAAGLLLVAPVGVGAQTDASLGVGAGTVRYTGGSSFGTASISPAFEWGSAAHYLSIAAFLSSLPQNDWAAQGRADLWLPLLRETHALRPALATTLGGSTLHSGTRSAVGHVLGEILWARPGAPWGVAIGGGSSIGGFTGELPVTALRLRARSWWQRGPVQYIAIAEPTRLYGAWYTDVTAGVQFERGPASAELWGIARLSQFYGSKGTASAVARFRITPAVALEAAAGGYLSEPFQGFPRAGYASLMVRVHSGRVASVAAPAPVLLPLVAERRGDSVIVRFQMPGARSVAIAGDWTGWEAIPLTAAGNDIWIGTLALGPGTYHFSLVVDGSEWVVPGGVATLSDGMGGLLAILTVP